MSKLPASLAYPTSKSAPNSLTVQYAKALTADHILVNAVAPVPARQTSPKISASVPHHPDRRPDCHAPSRHRPRRPDRGFFDEDGPVPW
jgi:NAD(P)-dependent dehydrogenase (short-subunit alcohol dehydrogenase family)